MHVKSHVLPHILILTRSVSEESPPRKGQTNQPSGNALGHAFAAQNQSPVGAPQQSSYRNVCEAKPLQAFSLMRETSLRDDLYREVGVSDRSSLSPAERRSKGALWRVPGELAGFTKGGKLCRMAELPLATTPPNSVR